MHGYQEKDDEGPSELVPEFSEIERPPGVLVVSCREADEEAYGLGDEACGLGDKTPELEWPVRRAVVVIGDGRPNTLLTRMAGSKGLGVKPSPRNVGCESSDDAKTRELSVVRRELTVMLSAESLCRN